MRKLLDLSLPILILTTVALFRDLAWVKVHDLGIIELVPLAIFIFGLFSILNERVIVTCLRSAIVHHYAFQLILKVLISHGAIEQDSLI